ncbi:MAG: YesL family protein [Clostridium sp.]|nr:YesL family protein [Clostridium sp.]
MLQGIFNYDNALWRFIGKLADLMILNLLWTICSIPIFTIGASTTALYYVTLKLAKDEGNSVFASYFRSFKGNFRQATALWFIVLGAGAVLAVDCWFFFTGQMPMAEYLKLMLTALTGVLFIFYLFIAVYVFPLQSRFYNPVKKTLLNAFFMSVRHLPFTLGLLAADLLLGTVFCFSLFYMPQLTALLTLFGIPLVAFVNSFFLNAVFKHYMPPEDEHDSSEASPLLGQEDQALKEAIESLKNKS